MIQFDHIATATMSAEAIAARPETPVKSRNMAKVAALSRDNFDAAYKKGLMGVSVDVLPNRKVRIAGSGREVVDYTRCGYLNLDSHPQILEAARKAVDDFKSTHFSVARTRLTAEPLARLERTLSALFGASGVIVFPTVAAANMGALPLLASGLLTGGDKPVIVFDRFAHVTLQYHIPVLREDTKVVVIDHNDLDALERICKTERKVAFVGDGAYSMGGAAPVQELVELQETYGLFIYLDDAHGISVDGEHGEGFARSQLPRLSGDTIVAASLGKGFGAAGGLLMVGSIEVENAIRRFAPTYGFSCAPNTGAVGAALASAAIHRTPELHRLQKQLRNNLQLFDALIQSENSNSKLPIRLVRIGNEQETIAKAETLLERGHFTSAVFFPTVARGQAALRLAVTAAHDPAEILDLSLSMKSAAYLGAGRS